MQVRTRTPSATSSSHLFPPHQKRNWVSDAGTVSAATLCEHPAVGNCRFYDASEDFPPGDRLQRSQGFFKGQRRDSILCACCFPSLQDPHSTRTPACVLDYEPRLLSVHEITFIGHFQSRFDIVECNKWASGTEVKTLQVSGLL